MGSFEHAHDRPRRRVPSGFARPDTAILGPHHRASLLLSLQRTLGNQAVQRVVQANADDHQAGLPRVVSPRRGQEVSTPRGHTENVQRQPTKKGRVVRVERVRKFRQKPPGPGAYTQEELNGWYERHPRATSAGGANLVDGERTNDAAYTPEELWWRGYYYAKTTVNEETRQAWESWLNDEGDGAVITVFVRFRK